MKRLTLSLAAAGLAAGALAATEADVEASFNPYKGGLPSFPGLSAGTVIGKANVEQFKDALDAGMYLAVKSGWTEIKVGPTTQFPLNKAYVEATRKGLNKTKLGAKNGEISGFEAGRPFPEEPRLDDPRAGEKIAWNFKYGINWGDNAAIDPFYWKYRNMTSGQVERTIKFDFHFLNFRHRVQDAPVPEVTPNPSELFRGIYVQVQEPQDLKNTQLLIQRYDDDLKFDDAYLYLGFQRRVRRLATGQATDAFLGSDLMIEDFEGYNGRVSDMKWTYKGTKNILMPYYNHNELALTDEFRQADGYKFVDFGGQGGCFPNISWQLRKVYVLEAEPVNGAHPIGKRVFHIDAQVYNINRTLIYDRKGELWKSWTIGKSHPDAHLPINKGTGIAIDDSFSMVDVQSKHCTTGQFKGEERRRTAEFPRGDGAMSDLRERWGERGEVAMAGLPGEARTAVFQATRNLYAALATDGEWDEKTWDRALDLVLGHGDGGGIGTVAGKPTILPRGMSQEEMNQRLANLPATIDAFWKGGRRIARDELLSRFQFVATGEDGVYRMVDRSGRVAVGSEGRPATLNVRRLSPRPVPRAGVVAPRGSGVPTSAYGAAPLPAPSVRGPVFVVPPR